MARDIKYKPRFKAGAVDALLPFGRELAYRAQAPAECGQTGITTVTDVTGAQISFWVPQALIDDGFAVDVWSTLRWLFCATGNVNGIYQTADESNATKSWCIFSCPAAGAFSTPPVATERITAAGWYFRKVRLSRSSGSGTISAGIASDATTGAIIKATAVKL